MDTKFGSLERPVRPAPPSLDESPEREVPLWISILLIFFMIVVVLGSGLYVGYRYFWNPFDHAPRLDSELRRWTEVVQAEPDNTEGHYQLGWTYYQRGEYDKAIAEYRKTLEIEPKHVGARYNLGVALMTKKDYPAAKAELQSVVDSYPKHELAQFTLGVLLVQSKDYDAAVQRLEQFLALDRASADGHYWIGVAYEGKGEAEKAVFHYQEALRFNPKHLEAGQALARIKN